MIDSAQSYRPWNKKMKNALDLIRPKSREKSEVVEQLTDESVITTFNEMKARGEPITTERERQSRTSSSPASNTATCTHR